MKHLPNILSCFRICLVPVFVVVYFSFEDTKTYAVLIYFLAALTDVFDGVIARRCNLITNLGKLLDPLGDKLMTFAVLICIMIDSVIPLWSVLVFVIKEILMGFGGLIIHKKAKLEIPPSNYMGKLSTVVFFVVCVVLMLFRIPQNIATIMISVAIGFMLMALGSYVITFSGAMRSATRRG